MYPLFNSSLVFFKDSLWLSFKKYPAPFNAPLSPPKHPPIISLPLLQWPPVSGLPLPPLSPSQKTPGFPQGLRENRCPFSNMVVTASLKAKGSSVAFPPNGSLVCYGNGLLVHKCWFRSGGLMHCGSATLTKHEPQQIAILVVHPHLQSQLTMNRGVGSPNLRFSGSTLVAICCDFSQCKNNVNCSAFS